MELNDMLNIITRIESIDDYTTDEQIDDLLGDVYYMLACECENHFATIVEDYKDQNSLPSTKSGSGKTVSSRKRVQSPIDEEDDEEEYDDPRLVQMKQSALRSKQSAPGVKKSSASTRKTTSKRMNSSDEDLLNDLIN